MDFLLSPQVGWVPDCIGLGGTLTILTAYILLQIKKLEPEGLLFSFLNCIGAMMILVSLLYSWNLSAFIMEVTWMIISVFGMFKSKKQFKA